MSVYQKNLQECCRHDPMAEGLIRMSILEPQDLVKPKDLDFSEIENFHCDQCEQYILDTDANDNIRPEFGELFRGYFPEDCNSLKRDAMFQELVFLEGQSGSFQEAPDLRKDLVQFILRGLKQKWNPLPMIIAKQKTKTRRSIRSTSQPLSNKDITVSPVSNQNSPMQYSPMQQPTAKQKFTPPCDYNTDHIHDVLLMTIFKSEFQLRWEIFKILGILNVGIPYVLPNPTKNEDEPLIFNTLALSSIRLEWRDNFDKRQVSNVLFDTQIPLVSCIRIGDQGCNKSSFLNTMCRHTNQYDMFQSKQSIGNSMHSKFRKNLGELGWTFFESGQGFQPILVLNLHGKVNSDTYLHNQRVQQLLYQMSNVLVIFVHRDPKNEFMKELYTYLKHHVTQVGQEIKPQILIWVRDTLNCLNEFEKDDIIYELFNLQAYAQKHIGVSPFFQLTDKEDEDSMVDSILPNIKSQIEDFIYSFKNEDFMRPSFQSFCSKQELRYLEIPRKIYEQIIEEEERGGFLQNRCLVQQKWRDISVQGKKMIDPGSYEIGELQQIMKNAEDEKRRLRKKQYQIASKTDIFIKHFLKLTDSQNSKERFLGVNLLNYLLEYAYLNYQQQNQLYTTGNGGSKSINIDEVRIDHLWREVSQVYEAFISNGNISPVQDYPRAAAQHLLDGFPLELLDGNTTHIQEIWVNALFKELNYLIRQRDIKANDEMASLDYISRQEQYHDEDIQHKLAGQNGTKLSSRVLVVSILGVQSSGKSTLLNNLFGTQLPVSAGKCTRGMFMQLISVRNATQADTQDDTQADTEEKKEGAFDWILVIDSEGIRAPDRNFSEYEGIRRDNMLGALAIGCADICILNALGEVNEDIKNILIIGVRAVIQKRLVNLHHRINFVHQQVQLDNKEALETIRGSLQTSLNKYSQQIGDQINQNIKLFSDVVDFDAQSDITFLPSCWVGEPPLRTPSIQYTRGAQGFLKHLQSTSQELREYRNFSQFQEDFVNLWRSLQSEDFVTRFKELSELLKHQRLKESLALVLEGYSKKEHFSFFEYSTMLSNTKDLSQREKFSNLYKLELDDMYTRYSDKLAKAFQQVVGPRQQEDWRLLYERSLSQLDNLHQSFQMKRESEFQNVIKIQEVNDKVVQLKSELETFIDKCIKTKAMQDKEEAFKLLRQRFEEMSSEVQKQFQLDVAKNSLNYYIQNLDGYLRNQFIIISLKTQTPERPQALLKSQEAYLELRALQSVPQSHRRTMSVERPDIANLSLNNKLPNPSLGEKGQGTPRSEDSLSGIEWTGESIDTNLRDLYWKVDRAIDGILKDAKSYNDYYLGDTIRVTKNLLNQFAREIRVLHYDVTEHFQARVHYLSYLLVIKKLEVVQKNWERAHLPQMRMEAMMENLENYITHRIEQSQPFYAASKDMALSLSQSINGCLLQLLTGKLSRLFAKQLYGSCWEAARHEMQLHIIYLIRQNRPYDVLKHYFTPMQFFKEVIQIRVQELLKDNIDEMFRQTVEFDLNAQKKMIKATVFDAILKTESSSFNFLRRNLYVQIKKNVRKKLRKFYPRVLETSVDKYQVSKKDYKEFWHAFEKQIDYFDQWTVEENMVFQEASNEACSHLHPCGQLCPFCEAPCLETSNHIGDHRCQHFPRGLGKGGFNTSTYELIAGTCADRFRLNGTFRNQNTSYQPVAFQEYKKYYPTWAIDGSQESNDQLAQYVFARFQKEIVEYWNESKNMQRTQKHRLQSASNIPKEWMEVDLDRLAEQYRQRQIELNYKK